MVTSAERRRLEAAYPVPLDARPVLRTCAMGLLAVLFVAIAAGILTSGSANVAAGISVQQVASGR